MGDISENFRRRKFACRCGCGFDTVDSELLNLLQYEIRNYYGQQVTIISGCRCFSHNLATHGAARNSLHIEAKAADIKVSNVSPQILYTYLNRLYPKTYGIGLYHDRLHVDVRTKPARWNRSSLPVPT